jgi:hypothetical protein
VRVLKYSPVHLLSQPKVLLLTQATPGTVYIHHVVSLGGRPSNPRQGSRPGHVKRVQASQVSPCEARLAIKWPRQDFNLQSPAP